VSAREGPAARSFWNLLTRDGHFLPKVKPQNNHIVIVEKSHMEVYMGWSQPLTIHSLRGRRSETTRVTAFRGEGRGWLAQPAAHAVDSIPATPYTSPCRDTARQGA
jgi:hypothetical protein